MPGQEREPRASARALRPDDRRVLFSAGERVRRTGAVGVAATDRDCAGDGADPRADGAGARAVVLESIEGQHRRGGFQRLPHAVSEARARGRGLPHGPQVDARGNGVRSRASRFERRHRYDGRATAARRRLRIGWSRTGLHHQHPHPWRQHGRHVPAQLRRNVRVSRQRWRTTAPHPQRLEAESLSGSGTSTLGKKYGILQTKCPDGIWSTQAHLRDRVADGVLHGENIDRHQTGQFVFKVRRLD